MKCLFKHGDHMIMVEEASKYYMVNLKRKEAYEVEHPNVILRAGYCEEVDPTEDQIQTIDTIIDAL